MFFLSVFGLSIWIALLTGLVGLYFYLIRDFKFWSSRGVDGPKPVPFMGTMWQMFLNPLTKLNEENSKRFGKVHGTFMGSRPVLVVSDPELIKQMNIIDFHLFVDRNDLTFDDVLTDRSLSNLRGDEWKTSRSIISPTFSSGKMRSMHPIIIDCVQRLEKYLENKCRNRGVTEVEMKKIMSNLTMDVIASCAFGTKIDTYDENKRSDFIVNAEKVFRETWRIWVFLMFKTTFPQFLKWIGFKVTNPSVAKFFRSAIRSIISNRKSSKGKHRDYLQLMINAQNRAFSSEEQEIEVENKEAIFGQMDETEQLKYTNTPKGVLTEDDILATSFIFFVAGYETTGSLLSFLFYSLAMDEKCQQKLFEEVISYNGNYEYESIAKMHYLEACVAETLRLYTPVAATGRMAAEEYTIGDTGITIPKGTLVNFDAQSIHHNPEYYPNPEVWNPERFMPENRDQLTPYTYMPFGIGPRNCVGMRFALMEAKTAIAHLVYKFKFFKTPNTNIELKAKKFDFLLNMGPLNVGLELRNKSN